MILLGNTRQLHLRVFSAVEFSSEMASSIEQLVSWVIFKCLILFWGSITIAVSLFRFILNPIAFFKCGNYGTLPGCAADPALGQHSCVVIETPRVSF